MRRRGSGGAPFFPPPNPHVDAFYYDHVSAGCHRAGARFRGIPAIRTWLSLFRNPTPERGRGGMRSAFPLCHRACQNRKAAPKAVWGYCAGCVYVPDPYCFENLLVRHPACRCRISGYWQFQENEDRGAAGPGNWCLPPGSACRDRVVARTRARGVIRTE